MTFQDSGYQLLVVLIRQFDNYSASFRCPSKPRSHCRTNQLLNEIYSKKNQIYLLNSKTEILDKELNFWMYGIDKIKIDEKINLFGD